MSPIILTLISSTLKEENTIAPDFMSASLWALVWNEPSGKVTIQSGIVTRSIPAKSFFTSAVAHSSSSFLMACSSALELDFFGDWANAMDAATRDKPIDIRSEEHTSELQSRFG